MRLELILISEFLLENRILPIGNGEGENVGKLKLIELCHGCNVMLHDIDPPFQAATFSVTVSVSTRVFTPLTYTKDFTSKEIAVLAGMPLTTMIAM